MAVVQVKTNSTCFSDIPTSVYGEFLRQQVEDRLKFYETGDAPKKNIDVMHEAMQQVSICNEKLCDYWVMFSDGMKKIVVLMDTLAFLSPFSEAVLTLSSRLIKVYMPHELDFNCALLMV